MKSLFKFPYGLTIPLMLIGAGLSLTPLPEKFLLLTTYIPGVLIGLSVGINFMYEYYKIK